MPGFKTKEEKKKYLQEHQILLTLAHKPTMTPEELDEASNLDDRDELCRRAEVVNQRMNKSKALAAKYPLPDGAENFGRIIPYYLREETTPEDKEYNEKLIASLNTVEGREKFLDVYVTELLNFPSTMFCVTSDADAVSLYENNSRELALSWPASSVLQGTTYLDPEKRRAVMAKLPMIETSGGINEIVNQVSSPFYSTFTPRLNMNDLFTITPLVAGQNSDTKLPDSAELASITSETIGYLTKVVEAGTYQNGQTVLEMINNGVLSNDFAAHQLTDNHGDPLTFDQAIDNYKAGKPVVSKVNSDEEIAMLRRPYNPEDQSGIKTLGTDIPHYEPPVVPFGNNNLREYMKTLTEHVATTGDKEYSEFISSVIKLNSLTESYYTPGPGGQLPTLGQEDLRKICNSYQNVIQNASMLPKGQKGSIMELQHNMASTIKELAYDDLAMLLSNKVNDNRTLSDSIEESRRSTVNVGNQRLSSSSGQLSARIPIEFTGTDGNLHKGFFTKESNFDTRKFLSETAQTLKTRYPAYTTLFEQFNTVDTKELYSSISYQFYQVVPDSKKVETVRDMFSATFPDSKEQIDKLLAEPNGIAIAEDIMISLDKYSIAELTMGYSDEWLKLKPGSNIDSRNSAMSAMANLLGMPDVIAHSEPMELVVDGKPFKGTFMENAEGREAFHLGPNDPMRDYGSEVYDNPTVIKQLANLQVLDYVCGNVDRHEGNFFFQFDETDPRNPKCTGITGIDNDCSFGTVSYGDNKAGNVFIRPKDMLVIPKSTADAVMSMDRSLVEASLKNFNFSKEELDKCWERTQRLQEQIRDGVEYFKDKPAGTVAKNKLRVLNDDEWALYNFDKLSSIPSGTFTPRGVEIVDKINNQFNTINQLSSLIHKHELANHNNNQVIGNERPAPAHGDLSVRSTLKDPRFADDLTRMKHANLLSMYDKVKDADPWYVNSSKEYAAMRKTLKTLNNIELGEPVDPAKHAQAKELCETLAAQAMSYIALKDGKTSLSETTLKRLTVANQVLETAVAYSSDGPKAIRNSHGEIVDFAPDTKASKEFISWQAKHNKWQRDPSSAEYQFLKSTDNREKAIAEFIEVRGKLNQSEDKVMLAIAEEARKAYATINNGMKKSLQQGAEFNPDSQFMKDSMKNITAFEILYMERMGVNSFDPTAVPNSITMRQGTIETVMQKRDPSSLSEAVASDSQFRQRVSNMTHKDFVDFFANHKESSLTSSVTRSIIDTASRKKAPATAQKVVSTQKSVDQKTVAKPADKLVYKDTRKSEGPMLP